MRAGKLDRRLTIQRGMATPDEFNAPVEVWADVATVWAQMRPNRGQERFAAQQIAGTAVMTFHIRFRADLRRSDRLLFEGRLHDIQDIREIGRHVVTEIDAIARGA